jgi:hypothetical protein
MLWEVIIKALVGLLMDVMVNVLVKLILEICSVLYTNYCQAQKVSLA